MQPPGQPLSGALVVDFTRYLPGAFASRELLRLGARVVHVEPRGGDPLRETAPQWDEALRGGAESVMCDLPAEGDFARALAGRADVVLEGFRPGVAEQLGIGPAHVPAGVVYCSITGFGLGELHRNRAGHDLNYLGWGGVLEDTAPGWPPIQDADLAAGALCAVVRVLAALLERERTGRGGHVVVSMTHGSHDLVSHRLGGDPVPTMLTGGLACYRTYATSDDRFLTVAALEPKFFVRLCQVLGAAELAELQYADDQEALAGRLAQIFAQRSLEEWLALVDGEDVCVGPVRTRAEAAAEFRAEPLGPAPALGEHTEHWHSELALS